MNTPLILPQYVPTVIEDNCSTTVATGDVLFFIGLLMFLFIVTGCLVIYSALNGW